MVGGRAGVSAAVLPVLLLPVILGGGGWVYEYLSRIYTEGVIIIITTKSTNPQVHVSSLALETTTQRVEDESMELLSLKNI